jgi:hypothetical protein
MKIAVILGRGVEGCGVTRCSIEFEKATPNTKIFATIDKKWARKDTMDFNKSEFKCGDMKETQKVIDEINQNFEMCLIYSVPSKTHPKDCQDNFVKLVQGIDIPKGIVQLDHKMQSLSRNAKFDEICNSVDVLMTHSLTSDFTRWAEREGVKTPFRKMALGFDYDGHRETYWKPINEQDSRSVRWIGRLSGWKGPNLMMDFHAAELMQRGYITVLEGLEASIGWKGILYDKHDNPLYKNHEINNFFRPRKELEEVKFNEDLHGTEIHGSGAYLYPPYNNVEAMQRMSLCAYGSDLYHLKPEMYGNNIENCHAECIASGTIPIFHKHFCDNVVHRKTGNTVSGDGFLKTGTIGLNEFNFNLIGKAMEKLSNDLGFRNEMREISFEYWKDHSDSTITVKEIINNLKDIVHQNGKLGAISEIETAESNNQLKLF